MERAFERLNFSAVQRAATRSAGLSVEIRRARHAFLDRDRIAIQSDEPIAELIEYTAARTDECIDLHEEVLDELEHGDVTDIAERVTEGLPNIPGRYLLPIVDASSRRRAESLEHDLSRWRKSGWNGRDHREALTRSSQSREALLFEALSKRKHERQKGDVLEKGKAGSKMRYFGASLRILAGTSLMAANVGVGLTAGLASTILTIGATSVPTYVGVITSVGTGLFQVADGLEKIGGIQKDAVGG